MARNGGFVSARYKNHSQKLSMLNNQKEKPDSAEKKGGCVSKGCGIMVAILILFLAIGFISNLLSDDSATDTPSQTRTTTVPAETVTSPPAEVEPTEPPVPEEESPKPPPREEEPVEPSATDNMSIEIAETIQKAPRSNEFIERHFTWEYFGEWNWDVLIPEALYDYYHEIPRPPTRNYSIYVTHPWDDPYINSMVNKIKGAAEEKGYDEYQMVEFTIAFVQSLPYTVDSVTSPFDEYPRYPVETLVDGGGDCEDTSILLAALLNEMGYGVVLLGLPEHMAVGLKGGENIYGTYWEYEGAKYYYIETTGSGRKIGELPDEYTDMSASIYTMQPVPIITHEWDLESEGIYVMLKVKVNNLGTTTAYNVFVFSGFDAGNDKVWSSTQSETFNLEPDMQVTATLYLHPPPLGVHTRLLVQVAMGGYNVSESYSDWFDY